MDGIACIVIFIEKNSTELKIKKKNLSDLLSLKVNNRIENNIKRTFSHSKSKLSLYFH